MKLKKFLFSILICSLFINIVHAAAPESFTVGVDDMWPPSDPDTVVAEYPIESADVIFRYKTNSEGKVIYCMEHDYYMIESGTWTFNYSKVASTKALGVIANGHPNVRITGDDYKDYFITSMALWYVEGTAGDMFDNIDLTNGTFKGEDNAIVKEIAKLVNKANSYRLIEPSIKVSNTNHNLTLSSDKKYYVSERLGVTVSGNIDTYTVDIDNAPRGTVVLDASGNQKNVFEINDKFYVRVPADSVTDDTSFDIMVSSDATVERAYVYVPTPAQFDGKNVQSFSTLYPDDVKVGNPFTLGLKVEVPEVPVNPPTGTIAGTMACFVGIMAICSGISYFVKLNKKKEENV